MMPRAFSTIISSKSKSLLLTLAILTLNIVHAQASNTIDSDLLVEQLQNKAKQLQLWQQNEWLNLLHFEGAGETPHDFSSSIRDKNFFLTGNEAFNAETELYATIAAIYDKNLPDDDNAQCRFIARFNWLSKSLHIDQATTPSVNCEKYHEWRENIQPKHVTLIFPTYHLNSPSSMFGHTLLRLDPDIDQGDSKWLSIAINFGANPPPNQNSLLYAYRGLAGGYPGTFAVDYYYKKIQEYNRIEHRDIWEYRLNLTTEETELMVTHLWELQDVDFDYYFFDENCSYRMLELLEVARPSVELTDEYIITAIPIDTVKSIKEAGLIESLEYRPARATLISHMLTQIPEQHHNLAIRLSEDFSISKSLEFTNLPKKEQRQLLEIAYKYLRYQQAGEGNRDKATAKRSHQLLKLRNSYPESKKPLAPPPVSPDKGHDSKRLSFTAGRRLDNYYGELGFKMSFHDLEDDTEGFLQGASINIGSLQIRAEENETIRLYKMDFVDIFSLAPRTNFFKPVAWRIYTGFERQLTKGVDQLGYHVTGGGGGNWNFLNGNQFYALVTGRLEINKQLNHDIEPGLGFITGLLSHFGTNTVRLEVSGEHFTGDSYRLRTQYTHNFVINRNNSLKIFAKYEWQENNTEFSDINLSYQYYFQ